MILNDWFALVLLYIASIVSFFLSGWGTLGKITSKLMIIILIGSVISGIILLFIIFVPNIIDSLKNYILNIIS